MKVFRNYRSILFILVAVLILTGDYLGLSWIPHIILIAVGCIAVFGAIRIFNQGEAYEGIFGISNLSYSQRYSSLSVWLIGLFLGLSGLIVIALSLVDLFSPGGASTFLSELIDSSFGLAIVLGVSGLMVTAIGMLRFLSSSATKSEMHSPFGELENKVGGVVSTVIGLILLILSIGTLFSPGFLKALIDQALRLATKLIQN